MSTAFERCECQKLAGSEDQGVQNLKDLICGVKVNHCLAVDKASRYHGGASEARVHSVFAAVGEVREECESQERLALHNAEAEAL